LKKRKYNGMAFVFGDSSSRNDGDIGDDVSKRVGITKAAEKALTKDIMTEDGFVNFTAKLGLGSENLTSYSQYGMSNILSRDRQRLEIMYRHSWLVGQVVDTIAEDMTKEGIELYSDMSPDDSQAIMKQFTRLSIWESIADNIKWGRLYGGSIAVILTEGADYEQPLNIQRIGKGKFKGLKVFDRWQVEPSLSDLITELGPDIGMPKYYTIMPGMETMGGQKIHYTRVIRYDGIKMPYNQKRFDNQWGMSVVERMFDRLLAFDSATTGAAQLMYKAYLRTVGVKGLRQALAMGGKTEQAVIKQFQYIRLMQSLEGITLLDSEDSFQTHTYSFGGVADVLQEFAQQISGATNIPLVRLFGQSPRGFSTGDTDLRNYYDNISKLQNGQLRNDVYRLVEVLSMSVLGNPLPKDFDFKFKPLYAMDSVQKSQIAATNANTINSAFQSGLITKKIGMKELAQQSAETGMFTNIDDEDIKNAVEEPPEHQGEFGNEEPLPAEELEKKLETEASSPDTDQVNSLSEQALESPDDLTRLSGELESLDAPNLEQLERELKSLDDTTFEELEATLKAIRIGESPIEEIDKFKGKVSSTTLEALEQQLSEILIEAPPKKMTADIGIGDLFKKIWKAVKAYTSDAERLRAPKGGVSIKGKEFQGGEFIPTEGGYAEEYKKTLAGKKKESEKETAKPAAKAKPALKVNQEKINALKQKIAKQSSKGIKRTKQTENFVHAKRNEAGEFVFEGNNKLPKHLEGFAIAPAYKHILVNPDPKANRWLIGFDESGQKVIGNIYSPEYEKKRLLRKDAMVHDLNKNIEIIHKELDTDIETKDLSNRQKAIIAKVMVITGARVGSSEKALGAKGKTYGAATLEGRHIIEQEDGTVKLEFIGKDSKLNEYDVPDKRIARILIKLKKQAGEEGRLFDEKYQRILNYVKQLDGGDYTPHNFRTKIGTDTAIEAMESMPAPKDVKEYNKAVAKIAKIVAKRLCNTPAVALKKYIMPSVWANWKTQAGIE
jgi:uncharacterized protein